MRSVDIRPLAVEDLEGLAQAFEAQGWPGRREVLAVYWDEQVRGQRQVWVAQRQGQLLGYITLKRLCQAGPFAGRYPEIADFNDFQGSQRQGIGTALIARAEAMARAWAPAVVLGVGLHAGYGPAQRLYSQRGYCPDGSGVWYQDRPLAPYAACQNDDDLVLYLLKTFD